jgi:2,3-bisphosphoglycerate-independent phosphoglycerate mutase
MNKKVILMILDGWGKSDPKVSAIDNANIPFIKSLYKTTQVPNFARTA